MHIWCIHIFLTLLVLFSLHHYIVPIWCCKLSQGFHHFLLLDSQKKWFLSRGLVALLLLRLSHIFLIDIWLFSFFIFDHMPGYSTIFLARIICKTSCCSVVLILFGYIKNIFPWLFYLPFIHVVVYGVGDNWTYFVSYAISSAVALTSSLAYVASSGVVVTSSGAVFITLIVYATVINFQFTHPLLSTILLNL